LTIFSFLLSACLNFHFFIFDFFPKAGLSTPRAHEHQDMAGGNQSDDEMSDQLGTQHPSTNDLNCPLLLVVKIYLFCMFLSIIRVASTTLLVLQMVSAKLLFLF
jgi:hypothetical protein